MPFRGDLGSDDEELWLDRPVPANDLLALVPAYPVAALLPVRREAFPWAFGPGAFLDGLTPDLEQAGASAQAADGVRTIQKGFDVLRGAAQRRARATACLTSWGESRAERRHPEEQLVQRRVRSVLMHEISLSGVDRKLPATAGTPAQVQRSLRLHAEAPPPKVPQLLPLAALAGATFTGVLGYALIHGGAEQRDVAREVHVSDGYMSRFVSGLGEQWARRVVRFMRSTGSLGPLQWIAEQVGCDVVQRDTRAARIAELEAQLADARRAA